MCVQQSGSGGSVCVQQSRDECRCSTTLNRVELNNKVKGRKTSLAHQFDQYTATRTATHTATHAATRCNTLQITAAHTTTHPSSRPSIHCTTLHHTLHHSAIQCNTVQHTDRSWSEGHQSSRTEIHHLEAAGPVAQKCT